MKAAIYDVHDTAACIHDKHLTVPNNERDVRRKVGAFREFKPEKISFHAFALCLLALSIASCTVIPKKVQSTSPSFSGTNFNSGFSFNSDGTGHIDDQTRERYNELIDIYGGKFLPKLRPDEGLSKQGDGWRIDQEHLVKLLRMDRWHREDNPR